ncbi:MAG: helix-turn-helix domain-containing protein [Pseudomonadota bacterium]
MTQASAISVPKLVTQKQAAEELGMDVKTLCKEVDSGRLRFVLVGKRRKYRLDDLVEYVERQSQWVSTEEKTPRSGGTRSRGQVFDFEKARTQKTRRKR